MSTQTATGTLATAQVSGNKDKSSTALIIGIIGLLASSIGLFLGLKNHDPRAFLGWLIGVAFWLSIGIGTLFLVLIGYIFDAGWSVIIRRQMEHMLAAFKWVILALLPLVIIGILASENTAVPWQWLNTARENFHGEAVGHDPLYVAKQVALNKVTFSLVIAIFTGGMILLIEQLRKHSYAMDVDGDPRHVHACRKLAAFGAVFSALGLTFLAIYLFKSLEYHWFSTMYGVWFFAASIRAATCAVAILCVYLASNGYLKGIFKPAHSYLIGCMLLAFTVFWAYISFCQYFLIYNANIPEETFWYQIREVNPDTMEKNSWWWVSMALIFCHFAIPFVYLLWYKSKFTARIVFISCWILFFHLIDLYWNILPGRVFDAATGHFHVRQFVPHLTDITTLVGVGGIVVWAFISASKKTRIIPIRDPRIQESLNAHE